VWERPPAEASVAVALLFWWWPFHPIGYRTANARAAKGNWMPFLVGWLAKIVAVHYGGL
jgi:hypothetical protein